MTALARKLDIDMPERRRPVTPPPLIMSLPGRLAEDVRRLADSRRDHAQSMIAALIDYMLATGKAEEMLAEMPSERPGQGRRAIRGGSLTQHQAAVLYLVGFNRDDDGVCRLSADNVGQLCGLTVTTASQALRALQRKRLTIAVGQQRGRSVVQRRLTKYGEAVFEELGGGE